MEFLDRAFFFLQVRKEVVLFYNYYGVNEGLIVLLSELLNGHFPVEFIIVGREFQASYFMKTLLNG